MRWLPGVDDEADSPLPRPDAGLGERYDPEGEPAAGPGPRLPVAYGVAASAAFLREASGGLRRLPVDARIAGICRVARSWLDPDDETRRGVIDAIAEECVLHPKMVAWGIDRAFEVITPDALRAWWNREGAPPRDDGPRLSGHVLAGNVFTAGVPPVIASVLAGVPAVIKAPSHQPTFAAAFAKSFALHAPELGPCVAAVAWSRTDERATSALFDAADVLFAFGDDESIDAIRARRPDVRGLGHRYSIAVVTAAWLDPVGDLVELDLSDLDPADAEAVWYRERRDIPDFQGRWRADLRALAADVLAWDGSGCLTPRWVFLESHGGAGRIVAELAVAEIEEVVNDLAAVPLSGGAGAERAAWLAQAAFDGWSDFGPGWGVASLPEPRLLPAPPPRVMCFLPLPEPAALAELLRPLGPRLQGVAVLGPEARRRQIAEDLAPLGVSRVCGPGELQRPPIDWNHDDVRILASLV